MNKGIRKGHLRGDEMLHRVYSVMDLLLPREHIALTLLELTSDDVLLDIMKPLHASVLTYPLYNWIDTASPKVPIAILNTQTVLHCGRVFLAWV